MKPTPKQNEIVDAKAALINSKTETSYNALVSSFIAKDAKTKQKDKIFRMLPPKPGPRMTPNIRDSGYHALTPPQLHNQIETLRNGKRFPPGPKQLTPI